MRYCDSRSSQIELNMKFAGRVGHQLESESSGADFVCYAQTWLQQIFYNLCAFVSTSVIQVTTCNIYPTKIQKSLNVFWDSRRGSRITVTKSKHTWEIINNASNHYFTIRKDSLQARARVAESEATCPQAHCFVEPGTSGCFQQCTQTPCSTGLLISA